jgi:hypothetical protein
MKKEIIKSAEFWASDSAGKRYLVTQLTELNDGVEGLKSLSTSNSQPLNWLGKGRYTMLSGEILTSDTPDAP